MDIKTAASALKELGHPTRLGVYKRLVQAGENGLPVGDLQKDLDVPSSTLSHHISALVSVNLVKQKREGRILFCTAQYEMLDGLITFLSEECCKDQCGSPQIEVKNHDMKQKQ